MNMNFPSIIIAVGLAVAAAINALSHRYSYFPATEYGSPIVFDQWTGTRHSAISFK